MDKRIEPVITLSDVVPFKNSIAAQILSLVIYDFGQHKQLHPSNFEIYQSVADMRNANM